MKRKIVLINLEMCKVLAQFVFMLFLCSFQQMFKFKNFKNVMWCNQVNHYIFSLHLEYMQMYILICIFSKSFFKIFFQGIKYFYKYYAKSHNYNKVFWNCCITLYFTNHSYITLLVAPHDFDLADNLKK